MKRYQPLFILAFVVACLWVLRCISAGTTLYYGFLFVNLFLATIPLFVELLFPVIKRRLNGFIRSTAYLFTGLVWVLFIPNAFYILTDFMHLNANVLVNMPDDSYRHAIEYVRGDAVFMLDSFLIFTSTLYGAYAGGLALVHAYHYFTPRLRRWRTVILISAIMMLSSVGIFIGRFGRWNSWDALYQPWVIITDLYQQLTLPHLLERFVIVIVTALAFHALSFYIVFVLAKHLDSTPSATLK